TQSLHGPVRVAFFVVEVRKRGNSFLRVGLQLYGRLEFVFGLGQVVVEAVKPPEKQVVIDVVGLNLDNLLVLLDGQLQDVTRTASGLHVAQRSQVDPAQQLVSFQVIGITLQDVLGFQYGIPDAACFRIKLGQGGRKILRGGVGLDSKPVLFDRLSG